MQQSIFDLMYETYKIDKPIRLIELFAGYGSQALALKYLGANFEHHCVCEFDEAAVTTYNAFHNTNFKTSDITQLKASDLNIVDKDKYTYLLTYSFPCTDLSISGAMKGMEKGSGTRSGLLWEVERLLIELGDALPQVLVMENVPQVLTASGWEEWNCFLNNLGYTNYCEVLNAKDYSIPQNRKRAFMISILGDFKYHFPQKMKLKYVLKDILEKNIDEKYYIPDEKAKSILSQLKNKDTVLIDMVQAKREGKPREYTTIAPTLMARDYKDPRLILVGSLDIKGQDVVKRVYDPNGLAPTLTTMQGGNRQPKIIVLSRVRKLSPKECFKLMGVPNSINSKVTVSNSQQYKQAGNSIVTTCLMGIFGELLGIDYQSKIKQLVEELTHYETK